MAKIKAKLRALDLRGQTTSTRWGDVTFDKDGLAELEVEESDLQLLRNIKPFSWLAEDHGPKAAAMPQEVPPAPSEASDNPPAEDAAAGSEELPPPPPPGEPFDTSDSEAPSGKKSGKKGR